jgi:formate dehydrogenase major subunit
VQKLTRAVFMNNNTDTCARVCHSPTGYGLGQTFGTSAGTQDFDSVEESDVAMVIGANPHRRTRSLPAAEEAAAQGCQADRRRPAPDRNRGRPAYKAAHHLALTPGTNVAVVTALAHVIVTEKLYNEEFIRTRCDWDEFQDYAEFIGAPNHSPEAVRLVTGVPAEEIRKAARLYATGGNAAIYYGLGVTEHSQGSTTVIGIANLAMLTGNIGRPGVGVNPLRGQNNVQGSATWGPSRMNCRATAM